MFRNIKLEEINGIIAAFQSEAVTGPVRRIVVSRRNVWTSASAVWQMASFQNRKGEILVKFVGDHDPEPSVDQGGPRREFFRLLSKAILVSSGLFSLGKFTWLLYILHTFKTYMESLF